MIVWLIILLRLSLLVGLICGIFYLLIFGYFTCFLDGVSAYISPSSYFIFTVFFSEFYSDRGIGKEVKAKCLNCEKNLERWFSIFVRFIGAKILFFFKYHSWFPLNLHMFAELSYNMTYSLFFILAFKLTVYDARYPTGILRIIEDNWGNIYVNNQHSLSFNDFFKGI